MTINAKIEKDLQGLLNIIQKLRSPGGCPWDKEQKKEDVGKYLLEEAYEVIEALDAESSEELKEELGDLLFQILFLSCLSEEAGEFNISDVIEDISKKMIRRHPHVFGDKKVKDIAEIKSNWDHIKKSVEKKKASYHGLLDKVPRSLPSLLKAQRITENASKLGFDWDNIDGVIEKIEEELNELKAVLKNNNQKRIEEEIGDLLFTLVNLCRFCKIDAEAALNVSLQKFIERFAYIEKELVAQGRAITEVLFDELDCLWNESKVIKKGTELE